MDTWLEIARPSRKGCCCGGGSLHGDRFFTKAEFNSSKAHKGTAAMPLSFQKMAVTANDTDTVR